MNFTPSPSAWAAAQPFPHCIIDRFLPEDILHAAQDRVTKIPWPSWTRYDSPFERSKSACNEPSVVSFMQCFLNSPEMVKSIETLTGITGLITDPSLHGGGFHRTGRGGFLDPHLDYSHHPRLNVERRITLIVYLNPFDLFVGGRLCLYDEGMNEKLAISPIANRAVLFENTPNAYHGHPEPLDADARYSFACFYHTAPRPATVPRPRAQFFALPGEAPNPEKDRLRAERAGIVTP